MKPTRADTAEIATIPTPTATVRVSDTDELDVWVVGEGTPVVLVHGAFLYFFLKPLAEELAKKGDYQAIWYHRRGYNGKPTKPVDVPTQAQDIVKILDELQISKAHMVGHSAGMPFVLALAMQAPDRVLSAAFFDFMLGNQVQSREMLKEAMKPVMEKAQTGDFEGAATGFLQALGGGTKFLERALPGSVSALVEDAATWFQVDMPALAAWTPEPSRVKDIRVPLAWLEVSKFPPILETGELLREWQPGLTVLEISSDSHLFPVTATEETAEVVDDWIRSQGRSV